MAAAAAVRARATAFVTSYLRPAVGAPNVFEVRACRAWRSRGRLCAANHVSHARISLYATVSQIAATFKSWGVGQRVTRENWSHYADCYWTLHRVMPRARKTGAVDGGKAYGTFTWRGVTDPRIKLIRGAQKPVWKIAPASDVQ